MKSKEEYNEYARNYYREHREHLLDLNRKRKDLDPKKYKDNKKKSTYKWRENNKEKYNSGMRDYRRKNPEIMRIIMDRRNKKESERKQKLRAEIIKLLGGKCSNSNCPILPEKMDIRALQIDHIKGNGSQERKKFQRNALNQYLYIIKEVKNGNKDYQSLCVYCNWIKRYENDELGDTQK
jgi:hypothetical protein